MPLPRLFMRTLFRILELHFVEKFSIRAIARTVGCSRSSVARILERAKIAKLSWPLPEGMTDSDVERILYPARTSSVERPLPNWMEVYKELSQHRSLTLHQVWTD